MKEELVVEATVDNLSIVNDFVHRFISQYQCSKRAIMQLDLIVEEIFVNIVNYSKADFINVNVEFEKPTLIIEFIDNGFEFNPNIKKNPKIPKTVEESQIGGLGIFLTKKMADELDYQYINGENHLKIIKKVE